MPIRIVDEVNKEPKLIDFSIVIATVEKNRDRIRSLGSMIISTTGILFSANLAFTLLVIDKIASVPKFIVVVFFLALALLLATLIVSISASFLRRDVSIVTEVKYLDDLLHIYRKELKIIRSSFILLILSLTLLFFVIVSLIYMLVF